MYALASYPPARVLDPSIRPDEKVLQLAAVVCAERTARSVGCNLSFCWYSKLHTFLALSFHPKRRGLEVGAAVGLEGEIAKEGG